MTLEQEIEFLKGLSIVHDGQPYIPEWPSPALREALDRARSGGRRTDRHANIAAMHEAINRAVRNSVLTRTDGGTTFYEVMRHYRGR